MFYIIIHLIEIIKRSYKEEIMMFCVLVTVKIVQIRTVERKLLKPSWGPGCVIPPHFSAYIPHLDNRTEKRCYQYIKMHCFISINGEF